MRDSSRDRRSRRFKSNACARVSVEEKQTHGRLVDVSAGGGFVAVSEAEELPPVGSGMRLDFRLPIGFWVRANTIVRWVRREADERGPTGFGVEFTSMQESNRELLDSFLAAADGSGQSLETTATDKYRVVVENGMVALCLAGNLDRDESSFLKAELLRKLEPRHDEEIDVFINALTFRASCGGALEHLTETFVEIGRRGLRLGVLVQPPALAGAQIRRVLRDAGIADSVASFETEVEASEFLSEIDNLPDLRDEPEGAVA